MRRDLLQGFGNIFAGDEEKIASTNTASSSSVAICFLKAPPKRPHTPILPDRFSCTIQCLLQGPFLGKINLP